MSTHENEIGDGGLRLNLTIQPEGNVEMGMRALGLNPYLLVEIEVDKDSSVVLQAQAGGFPDGDLDDVKQLLELLDVCLKGDQS